MKKRTLLFRIVAGCLMAALLLAGCTSNQPTTSSTPPANSSSSAASTASVASSAPVEKAPERAPVDLVWYVRWAERPNTASVLEKVNEITKAELNVNLDLQYVNPGDYNDKMQIILSSGEEFDICWTSEWANKYDSNVSKGAYIEMEPYLNNELMPDVLAAIPEGIWEGTKVNGKIYGIPCMQVMYDQSGLWFQKDLVDKYKLDVASVKSWSDLTPIFETIKQNEPDIHPYRGTISGTKLENMFLEKPFTIISSRMFIFDPDTKKVTNDFFEQNMDTLKIFREWYLAGYTPADAATLQDEDTLIRAGKLFSRYSREKPGNAADLTNNYGFPVMSIPTGKLIINTAGVQSTLNAISITSKNPDRAAEFLNLTYKNADLYNLLVFGIEGQDYDRVDANHIKSRPDQYVGVSWQMGNQFNAYLTVGQPDNVWEETIKNNAAAAYDPLLGFVLNRSPIETQLAACEAVFNEYQPILLFGLDDPEKIVAEMNTKLQSAGIAEATAEIQKQVDAFLASK